MIPNGKAPGWAQDEVGVEFSDPDQYISIPSFIPKAGTPTTPIIFTVNFWLKIENMTDNNAGYIFRYCRPNNVF